MYPLGLPFRTLSQQHEHWLNAVLQEVTNLSTRLRCAADLHRSYTPLQAEIVHPADVEANAEVSAAYARKVASHRPPLPAALSLASPKSISSFTEPDSLKLAVPSSTASHPKVDGDNDDSSEAGQSEDGNSSFYPTPIYISKKYPTCAKVPMLLCICCCAYVFVKPASVRVTSLVYFLPSSHIS